MHEDRRSQLALGNGVEMRPLTKQGGVAKGNEHFISYKDALSGSAAEPSSGKLLAGGNEGLEARKVVKFSYVERSSKEWMDRSVVGRRKSILDAHVIQARLSHVEFDVQIFPIGEVYCYISFPDEASLSTFLQNRLLEEWFSEVMRWEESDLANGDLRWICLSGVPIPAWNDQFFSFVVAEFGEFLGVSSATEMKLNLKEVWLKVRYKCGVSIPHVIDVHLPFSGHQIQLEVYSPDNTPLRSVSGLVASGDCIY